MRFAVLRGGQMALRENVPEPEPGPGQVVVAVKACSICGSDLHLAKYGDEVMSADEQMFGAPGLTAGVDLDRDVFMGPNRHCKIVVTP
jgi:threonine dehydrogenase-like Zn-dependent dehydrogenase